MAKVWGGGWLPMPTFNSSMYSWNGTVTTMVYPTAAPPRDRPDSALAWLDREIGRVCSLVREVEAAS